MLPQPIETVCMAFRTDYLDKLLFVLVDTRSTISVTSLPTEDVEDQLQQKNRN